jgi:hypothetical protein
MYINHLTVNTGHLLRTERADVRDDVLAVMAPWLAQAIASDEPVALPLPDMAQYSARALVQDGALVVTVYVPAGPYRQGHAYAARKLPLVTLAVAQRSRQGRPLWGQLHQAFGSFMQPGLEPPAAPWLAVVLLPSLVGYPATAAWLGDFERCVAWAWITRNPGLQAV